MNLLITAASRRVPLIRAFMRALRETNRGGAVITTDVDPLSPGLYVSDRHYHVSLATAPEYIEQIKGLCREEHVSLVIPTIDEELPLFGRLREEFAELGVTVLVSRAEVAEICNDKYLTYQFFKAHDIPTPETYLPEEVLSHDLSYPLFLKPRRGRGSVGAYMLHNRRELEFFLDYVDDPIVQRYVDGSEYTIDVLCDFESKLISAVPRERIVIRSGVTDRGRTRRDLVLIKHAYRIVEALRPVGPINIQCKVEDGRPEFFEINPRFSGGIPLTIAAGARFPHWVLDMAEGKQVPYQNGQFTDNLTMLCYEDAIFRAPDKDLAANL